MAKGNFEACAAVTLTYEGGLTMDRRDPGNWTGGKVGVGVLKGTNMGIAANTFPNEDIKGMTKARAMQLYRPRYWDGIKGDDLPYGVDLVVYDYGVNSGPSRAAKALQAEIGAVQDGLVGPKTIALISDPSKTIKGVCARRSSFVQALKTYRTFGRGWSRRIADVEAKAVAMYFRNDRAVLQSNSKLAQVTSNGQAGAGAGIGAGGATAGTTDAVSVDWLMSAPVVVIAVAVSAVLLFKAYHNRNRARAYAEVADA